MPFIIDIFLKEFVKKASLAYQNIQILLSEPFHYEIHIAGKLKHSDLKDRHPLDNQLNGQLQFCVVAIQAAAEVILKSYVRINHL